MTVQYTTELRTFFADGKHTFKLTFPLITELERSTGTGIGAISKRIFAQDYRAHDLSELIRLALIGGGAVTPERALQLVETYVLTAPLAQSIALAIQILEATFFGHDVEQAPAAPVIPDPIINDPIITAATTGDMAAALNQVMEEHANG